MKDIALIKNLCIWNYLNDCSGMISTLKIQMRIMPWWKKILLIPRALNYRERAKIFSDLQIKVRALYWNTYTDNIVRGVFTHVDSWAAKAIPALSFCRLLGVAIHLISPDPEISEQEAIDGLIRRVKDRINEEQKGKPIYGVLHFFTETGTEGGYWALQDKRFITPRKEGESHDQWDYWGLHILEDGDQLEIYDKTDGGKILWSGVVDLGKHELFSETTSHGFWKHADQKGVEQKVWEEYFFKENYAKLVKKNNFLI